MPLVQVSHLAKHFVRGKGLFHAGSIVRAVDDVSFDIEEGETFGLVGESGSGKTTTGRCLLRLIEPTSGSVMFRGEDVLGFSRSRLRAARRDMQIVFQDPYSSLNPRMRARQIVEEPLIIHELGDRERRRERVAELFRLVGLDPAHLERYPASVQRRAAPADRPGSRARASSIVPGPGRTGLGAGRVGAGAGRRPADGSPAAAQADVSVHRARSPARGAHLHARRGDVPGKDRRDRRRRRRCSSRRSIPIRRRCCRPFPSPIPTRRASRIVLDPASIDRDAALREITSGHFAAV